VFKKRKKDKQYDKTLLFLTLLLTALGLVAIADASSPQAVELFNDSFYFLKQQLGWAALGLVALLLAAVLHYSLWKKLAPWLFALSIILLVVVLIPGVGNKLLGARRWISLGPITLQPSEFVKLTLAMFMAWLAEKEVPFYYYALIFGLVAFLIMLQPDLGTTIVVLGIGVVQLFVMGAGLLNLGVLLGAGGLIGFLLIIISSYRRQRLMTFFQNSQDPLGSSYHIRQVLLALGSGGIFGVGLGQGRQKHLFLPEAATDSVFAVIAEEIGFVGSVFLIFIFVLFVLKMIKIAQRSQDRFAAVLAVGIAAWIGGQMFLNIGSMVALVPLTGVPLPFFSYGGSSLTMILLGVGILLNISKNG
jgi:cell division protein FtsW